MGKRKEKPGPIESPEETFPANKNSETGDKVSYNGILWGDDDFENTLRRVRAVRRLGITERDLEENRLEQVFTKLSKLSEADLQRADAFIDALREGVVEAFARSVLGIENAEGSALNKKATLANDCPRATWSDEMKKTKAEGRRNPAQFTFDEYGEDLNTGRLTRADIRTLDRQLYQALATWVRRLPEDDEQLKDDDIALWAKHLFGTLVKERVSAEIEKYGIVKPEDAFRRVPNRREAERLYSATKRRQLRS